MSAVNESLIVLTTVEKPDDGERLAQLLVENQLAACVQILPPMISIYSWQGKLERTSETLLLIKTTRASYPALEETIKLNHSYEIPEIIALPILEGSKDYLEWLNGLVGFKG